MNQPVQLQLRSIVLATEIAASPAVLWHALTDAGELMRWFPLEAEVQPGATMRLSWGDPVVASWRIDIWEPERRLHVVEIRPLGVLLQPSDGGKIARTVDFQLIPRGERTAVHLVHEGFGCGPEWDSVYGAVRSGWEFQLQSLKHYVERYRGADRSLAKLRRTVSLTRDQVWARLVGPNGVLACETSGVMATGSRFVARIDDNLILEGNVLICDPPKQIAATVSSMSDSLFRIYMVENSEGAAELSLWVASYGLPAEAVKFLELRWAQFVDSLFPPREPESPEGAATKVPTPPFPAPSAPRGSTNVQVLYPAKMGSDESLRP